MYKQELNIPVGIFIGTGLGLLRSVPGSERIWFSPVHPENGFVPSFTLLIWVIIAVVLANRLPLGKFMALTIITALIPFCGCVSNQIIEFPNDLSDALSYDNEFLVFAGVMRLYWLAFVYWIIPALVSMYANDFVWYCRPFVEDFFRRRKP